MSDASLRQGYVLGLTSYVLWGLFPFYFKPLESIPALEIIVQRVLGCALVGGLLLLWWRHPGWWRELRNHPKRLMALSASGFLIGFNWTLYVWAVTHERMIEASLGYYINPLVNVLLGLLLLGERLRRLQWLAVALAALGVALQVWQFGAVPWVSLGLALSFGFYALIRKQAQVSALPGLVVETWLMVPVALIWWLGFSDGPTRTLELWLSPLGLWLAGAGVVTLVPLLCFAAAARMLPLSTLGFLQYIAPTLVLLAAVMVYDEPFDLEHGLAFVCIWVALVVFSYDSWQWLQRQRASKRTAG
ncbi:EamA family transporter RarD [Atopomonas sediminilitoris]|uniref:EamA family transporter RarD n=1 Tax=Atopomonas sediminilitoris TaxID=2919919 RepID=UPI001F4EBC92|nr:EamA family transporter RarD [Atopomonas sediminilitoris]MCJ8170350.1 EamA family transporter RarD [Atopomonas sediminilitoris]